MYPTNPPGIELCYHVSVFFCFGGKTTKVTDHMSENTLLVVCQSTCFGNLADVGTLIFGSDIPHASVASMDLLSIIFK